MTGSSGPAWADILRMYERIVPRHLPQHFPLPAQDWDLSPAGMPPVLSTEHPFPIRYAATVWEQLHPLGELLRRELRVQYLPNALSNVRKR